MTDAMTMVDDYRCEIDDRCMNDGRCGNDDKSDYSIDQSIFLGDLDGPLKALIFDSWFRQFKGVVSLFTLKSGTLKVGDKIQGYYSKKTHTVQVGETRGREGKGGEGR